MNVLHITPDNTSKLSTNFYGLHVYFSSSLAGYLRQRTPGYKTKFYGRVTPLKLNYVVIDLRNIKL